MTDTPAIFFHSDAIETPGKDLVGRRSSGQSFLKGFLRHLPGDHVHALTENSKAGKQFEAAALALGETRPLRISHLNGQGDFTKSGAVFFPSPGYQNAPWRRQHFGTQSCSLIGITHTVSTRRVIENLHKLLLEPIEPWDAIICTSRAVQAVVQTQMDLQVDYITQRFGAARVPVPQLPVIPLGINTDDFGRTDADRAAMRARFGAPDDATVIMTMGRLTSVEKANPVPMFMALEEVAQKTGKAVHLWMVGWAAREDEAALHRNGAKALCPSVVTHIIDGREADIRKAIWAGADVFTLPVDNIQETFGLVPVEAMATGLPVVMPDWNGFRDTVVHGVTGMLIPTTIQGPGSKMGKLLARRFADGSDGYLHYLSIIQQQTQIDVRAYAAALTALVQDPALRRKMGAAGAAHVAANFDWSAIIPQYLALADELRAMRHAEKATSQGLPGTAISPIEVDPFALYAQYPSHVAYDGAIVRHLRPLTAKALETLDAFNGRTLYRRRLVPDATVLNIAKIIVSAKQMSVADIAKAGKLDMAVTLATVLFLAKYDFVVLDGLKPN